MEPTHIKQFAEAAARAFQGRHFGEAETYALRALMGQTGEPLASEVLGRIRMSQRRMDDAIKTFEAGWKATPNNAELPNLIGAAYAAKGDFKTALGYFQRSAQAAPNRPMPWENLGKAAFKLGRWSHARAAFERCLEIDSENVEASVGLAQLELEANDPAHALELASGVVARRPDHLSARHVIADAHLRLGDFEQAFAEATTVLQHPKAWPNIKALTFGIAADAADALGRYDEAFANYTAMNNATAEIHRHDIERAQRSGGFEKLAELAKITPQLAKKSAQWPRTFDTPAPIFFMGFPRTGMSVLEQMLSNHPLIARVEARPNIESFADLLWPADMPKRMVALTHKDIQGLRVDFWKVLTTAGVELSKGRRLLEWKPFYSQHLPLFAMIFPDAQIIFGHRDPRDIVLSCFQKRFPNSRSMYEFLDLEKAAHYYDLAMGVAWAARKAFDLDLTEVRYEKLKADPEGEARRVLKFLGLPWDDEVLRYQETASDGETKVPSASSAAQPVYTDALDTWRNYEAHLAPVRSILDTWAARFGYE